jgi:plastocyanin
MSIRSRQHWFWAVVLLAILPAPFAQHGRFAGAQDATPVPDAQTWNVQVGNVSPDGENWSFNAFYPDHLQVHPGDTISFTLAPGASAVHNVHMLALGMTPKQFYQGFSGGFVQPNLARPGEWQSTFFGYQGSPPCGRSDQPACVFIDLTDDISFGIASPVLVNPRDGQGTGNTSYTLTIDAAVRPGPYYLMSDVDGPTMVGRIDVLPFDQPVQSAGDLEIAAVRQYEADLAWLAGHERIDVPAEASNPDGTKTWQVAAGSGGRSIAPDSGGMGTGPAPGSGGGDGGAQAKMWLAINAFSPSQLVVIAGDTVTWTNVSSGSTPHAVAGFGDTPAAVPADLYPFQPGCMTSSGELVLPAPGSFQFDIWNTCPGMEVNNLTAASQPSEPSGEPYIDGERTSGILLNQDYIDSPIGAGLPFTSSYSITFPNPGVYAYECPIHPGMTGNVVVIPKPRPR